MLACQWAALLGGLPAQSYIATQWLCRITLGLGGRLRSAARARGKLLLEGYMYMWCMYMYVVHVTPRSVLILYVTSYFGRTIS